MLTDVGIADVIRAWHSLGAATEAERRAIAATLGFDLVDAAPAPAPIDDAPSGPSRPSTSSIDAPISPSIQEPSDTRAQPIELVPFTRVVDERPNLPATGIDRPVANHAKAAPESLFAARWARSIAATLTARSASVGPIDIERALDRLVHRLPMRRLPRHDRLISAIEITVVIDRKGTLAWFQADAEQLVRQLDRITRTPVTVVETEGAPVLANATFAPADGPRIQDAIHVGASGRIIALTDLGLGSVWSDGDHRRAEGWLDLARSLRARDTLLAIVTPVPAERIPPPLRQLAACVNWDDRTRPGTVHRLIKGKR